jgi:hypothetical protein
MEWFNTTAAGASILGAILGLAAWALAQAALQVLLAAAGPAKEPGHESVPPDQVRGGA